MPCMARSGFLTLRDCGNPEAQACAKCGRPMCTAHLSARSGFTECLDCASRAENLSPEDPEWAYGYRRQYYGTSGYAPLYFGHGAAYDDYDVRSFDSAANVGGPVDDAHEGDAGFGDS